MKLDCRVKRLHETLAPPDNRWWPWGLVLLHKGQPVDLISVGYCGSPSAELGLPWLAMAGWRLMDLDG